MSTAVISANSTHGMASLSPQVSDRNIKRKFDDAIQVLDEAVGPQDRDEVKPPPSKRFKTARSLYSTLAKYGIGKATKPPAESTSGLESLSKTAPHLAAILSRSASRSRKPAPFAPNHPLTPHLPVSSAAEYRPSSTASFLSRLATFKLTTYANKPPAIDAVAAAKCGWTNDGKDRLVCGICDMSWVVAGREGMNRDAANALIEKQRLQLVSMHKDGCPWKTQQCDASIYRVQLQAPVTMAREVKARAHILHPVLQNVDICHPMTSAQVSNLRTTLQHVKPSGGIEENETQPESDNDLSDSAMITSLFGWAIPPVASPPSSSALRSPSVSRATSVAPGTRTPRATRILSPSGSSSRTETPSPSPKRPIVAHQTKGSSSGEARGSPLKADATLLQCSLCQRRIGLWAFISEPPLGIPTDTENGAASPPSKPRRQLDVLKEHRSYCPYVIRSTVIPSLPVPIQEPTSPTRSSPIMFGSTSTLSGGQPGAVEGWRAVLTMITRYGSSLRQRAGLVLAPLSASSEVAGATHASHSSDDMEQDEVQAMVANVKSRGGKDLLRYVKGLLG